MEKKIKIRIGYPWAGVPDDVDIVTIIAKKLLGYEQ